MEQSATYYSYVFLFILSSGVGLQAQPVILVFVGIGISTLMYFCTNLVTTLTQMKGERSGELFRLTFSGKVSYSKSPNYIYTFLSNSMFVHTFKNSRWCYASSVQLFFLRKVIRQNSTDVTSFCVQFEKVGHGLLREAFQREG